MMQRIVLWCVVCGFGAAAACSQPPVNPNGVSDTPAVVAPKPLPMESVAAGVWADIPTDLTGTPDEKLSAKLETTINQIFEKTKTKAPGLSVAVATPGSGIWSTVRGRSCNEPPTDVPADGYFYWASVGKAYTAVIVLQLVEEGKLSLDAKLADWFPKFPNAREITIDHLLTHTGGVYSFQLDPEFRKRTGHTTPEELIRIAAGHDPEFKPGEKWGYSNTGYVLLGQIIEQIEKQSYHKLVQRRIVEKLGLTRTIALSPKQQLNGLAVGHTTAGPDKAFEPSTPFAAGVIAATPKDVLTFWQAVLTGKLLKANTVKDSFARLHPMFGNGQHYGRGVMLYKVPSDPPTVWLGHSGGTPSAKAVVAYDIPSRTFVAVAVNGDVPAEAVANKLLETVKRP